MTRKRIENVFNSILKNQGHLEHNYLKMNNILSIICVSLLWGITNPLIKKGTANIKEIKSDSRLKRIQLELHYLITNAKYLAPMGLNQLGSLLYFFTLQNSKLSVIVPVTNSFSFLITTVTSIVMGEQIPNKRSLLGMLFILTGALCCSMDQRA